MTALLNTLFAWPQGIVVGNLIASFIWAAPAFTVHHILIRRHITRTVGRKVQE